jgi:hypothetical protein
MSVPIGAGRDAFRLGDSNNNTATHYQNDVAVILSQTQNPGLTLASSAIGHSFATATAVPLVGNTIDVSSPLHDGLIVPASSDNPQPIGINNYTKDDFKFTSNGVTPITLTVHDGDDLLTPGVADPNATLNSILNIYNSSGTLLATEAEDPSTAALEDPTTFFETYTGLLSAGNYYAEVTSFGGRVQQSDDPNYNPAYYYDTGSYFLTGTGFAAIAVPEPTSIALAGGLVGIGLLGRRRRV